jgi:hypothetical protein
MSCGSDLILSFPVVFCTVRTSHEFDLGLFEIENLTTADQLKVIDEVTETFLTGIACFHHKVSAVMKESHPHSKSCNHSLE